jgi:DNA polymerase-3 subunit delta
MPSSGQAGGALLLICGEDEFTVKRRAREVFSEWTAAAGGFDQEIIDASAANSGEALKALRQLRDALQSLPLFGGEKTVWFKNCNFLGDERAAEAAVVTEYLAGLADEWKQFAWTQVRLLISAGKVDRRKLFFKTVDKLGCVELHEAASVTDKDELIQVEAWARDQVRARHKQISADALSMLIEFVGSDRRSLDQEIEKLALYTAPRPRIEVEDVNAIVSRRNQARAFALAEALGDRHLGRLLQALEGELWELRSGTQKSEIGILYGLIGKVRVLLFLQEMIRQGWVRPETEYARFKAQLENVPQDWLPADRRLNPLAVHPYVLFKALGQTRRYSPSELIQAMERLLECNRRLVSTGLDPGLVLQQALVGIVQPATSAVIGH